MSLDAMKQALAALELLARYENPATKIQVRKPRDGGSIVTMYPHKVASEAATALRAAIEQAHGDWDEVEALRASLREHMAEIHRLRAVIEINLRDDRRGEKNT